MNFPQSQSTVFRATAIRVLLLIAFIGLTVTQHGENKVPMKLPLQCIFNIERNRTELDSCKPPFLSYDYENSREPVVCVDGNFRDPDTVTHANSFDLAVDPPYRISIAEEIVKTPRGLLPRLEAGDFCLYFIKAEKPGNPQSGALPGAMMGRLPVQCYFHVERDMIRSLGCVSAFSAFSAGRPGIYREPHVDPPKREHFPKRVKQ